MTPLLFVLAACAPDAEPAAKDTAADEAVPAFDAPWEGLEATGELTGNFSALVGDDLAGPGWFHANGDDLWGAEGAWAGIAAPEGASQDVVTVSIAGRTADRLVALQFVVALSAWAEGTIDVDGEAAAGIVLDLGPGAALPLGYVVGGALEVNSAGAADGEQVEGSFTEIAYAEVSP